MVSDESSRKQRKPRMTTSKPDSVELLRRDHSSLASTVTNLVQLLGSLEQRLGVMERIVVEIQTDREVRKERDRNLNERLGRIERSIEQLDESVNKELHEIRESSKKGQEQIVNLGKYILGAIFMLVLGSGYSFLTSGALNAIPN